MRPELTGWKGLEGGEAVRRPDPATYGTRASSDWLILCDAYYDVTRRAPE